MAMTLTLREAHAMGLKVPVQSKPKRPKKPPAPDSFVAHDCVILAIDPANVSGYAVLMPDHSLWSGAIAESQPTVVKFAQDAARDRKRPLIVVAEKWTTGNRTNDRRMHAMTLLGLGAAWERWKRALTDHGVPRSRVVRVNVATWRGKVLGGPMSRTTEQWKQASLRYVGLRFSGGNRPVRADVPMQDDEADAICIACWAMHAGPVGEAIKKAGKRFP